MSKLDLCSLAAAACLSVCWIPSALQTTGLAAEQTSPRFLQKESYLKLIDSEEVKGWLELFRPPDSGRPDDTTNGSSRDGLRCLAEEPLMQPFLPEEPYGLTLQARPEIAIDIPATSARQVLLAFRNESGSAVHRVILPVPATAGLASFRLPDNVPSLEPAQTYRWSLTFICGEYYRPGNPAVTGWVRRMLPTAETNEIMATRSPAEQARWLSENGYWYDLSSYLQTASAAE